MSRTSILLSYYLFYFLRVLSTPLKGLIRLNEQLLGFARLMRFFKFRPDDIVIVSYPKSGTTWLQMILYQLTTDGSMDFPHIAAVSPHIEEPSPNLIRDIDQLPAPRIFKSHLSYKHIPKGPCKYIYISRDGLDVAVSFYHHHQNIMGFKGSLDQFMHRFLAGKVAYGSWFKHVSDWRKKGGQLDTLFLTFEALKQNPEATIRRIAAFCNLAPSEETISRTLERSSFAYMKERQEKFDIAQKFILEMGFNLNQFIRVGEAHHWKEHINPAQERLFREACKQYFGDATEHGSPPRAESKPAR